MEWVFCLDTWWWVTDEQADKVNQVPGGGEAFNCFKRQAIPPSPGLAMLVSIDDSEARLFWNVDSF